ncbi:hypothetical protein DFP72DRAFT_869058 [Ephemerocybe angulata]|uniref:Uncharacterized protein n=1 Tax=Ephemerocybe angulata TaxID=980116 RepID=A0A8H6IJ14_9AGAR|nr:hypothetical protein DFP72DRAFT_869058 [Tulosesus angulatus]
MQLLLQFTALLSLASIVLAGQHKDHLNRVQHQALARRDPGHVSLQKRYSNARWSYYDAETGAAGACGQMIGNNDWAVALNTEQYGSGYPGPNCFKTITLSYGGKTATGVKILDQCPGCPWGGLDLTPGLFAYFASHDRGIIYGEWSFGDAAAPAPAPVTTTTSTTVKATPTTTWKAPTTTSTTTTKKVVTTTWTPAPQPTTTWTPPATTTSKAKVPTTTWTPEPKTTTTTSKKVTSTSTATTEWVAPTTSSRSSTDKTTTTTTTSSSSHTAISTASTSTITSTSTASSSTSTAQKSTSTSSSTTEKSPTSTTSSDKSKATKSTTASSASALASAAAEGDQLNTVNSVLIALVNLAIEAGRED